MIKIDLITYALLKKQIQSSISKVENGKSAYELAVDSGYTGTQEEWLKSLQGKSPEVGENGNWFVDGVDTGVYAKATKITMDGDELVVNVEQQNISVVKEGISTIVGEATTRIDNTKISSLF